MIIKVEDYFNTPINPNSSQKDKYLVMELRNQLNQFYTLGEQYDYLKEYRKEPENIEFDKRVFGFSRNSKLYEPSALEKSNVNIYYQNLCDEVEIEKESDEHKKKRKKLLTNILFFGSIISFVWGIIMTINRYGGIFCELYVFQHTPFGICSLDLDETSERFVKCLEDDQGIMRYLPGNAFEYEGYAEEHEGILAGEIPKWEENEEGELVLVRPYKIFDSEDWGGTTEQRGVGTFGLLAGTNAIRANVDSQRDYVVCMRWEYMPFWLAEPDGNADNPKPGRGGFQDRIDMACNDAGHPEEMERSPVEVDAAYKAWLAQQKVIIFNPVNHKSIVCELTDGNGGTLGREEGGACLWGSDNPQRLGLLSRAAIRDLEYDTTSDVELDVYFIPPDLGEINAGAVDDALHIVDNNCELLRSGSGRGGGQGGGGGVGQPIPGGGGGGDGDGGVEDGWVAENDDDWMKTITPEYKELLIKYGFWPDKAKSTACASYVSIYLAEKYGDITPTPSTAVLFSQLANSPNYTNLGKCTSGASYPRETVFIRVPGTAGKKYGHTYLYVGDDVTGVPGKGFISASLNDHGPIASKQNSTAAYCDMFVHK